MPLELMSPAGNYESVVAAVRGGADAVYFGAPDFNARRGADNLNDETMLEALRFCRLRGVKTYITVNTLVTDRELLRAHELISRLSSSGADAVIVQDLGMARMVRAAAPDLPMHASTQLSVHNLGGAIAAQRLGFSRVVLARELPLDEIEFISKHSPIETEVFCHGALCMSHSGQCYMSSVIGGRSGNRGMCAQPCRMSYSFFGGRQDHMLSLKDLNLLPYLNRLEQAGVACVKIEGRMKRPEYTALVTSIYRRAIDTGLPPTAQDMQKLDLLFSRDGFTDGYLTDNKGEHMFGMRTTEDGKAARVLYKEAQGIYKSQPEPPSVGLSLCFTAKRGQDVLLKCTDQDGNVWEATSPAPEEALNRPTTKQEIEAYLSKTGGTVFRADRVDIELDSGLRLASSTVNAMRRKCTDGLTSIRRRAPDRTEGQWQPGVRRLPYKDKPGLIFSFTSCEQITSKALSRKPDFVYLPLDEIVKKSEYVQRINTTIPVAAVLDRIIFDKQWPAVLSDLKTARTLGIEHLVCTNIGQMPIVEKLGFSLRGDFGLNVMNSQAIKELRSLGLGSCTLSFELNVAQMRDMSLSLDCELIAYGRLQLMVTENCIIKRRSGKCMQNAQNIALVDKTGRHFPLLCKPGHRNIMLNAEKLYLADKLPELSGLGLRHLRLDFTTETAHECVDVINAYCGGEELRSGRTTRGLYFRGVQ